MWTCKHCNLLFDFSKTAEKANHSRWCISNPKNIFYREQIANHAKILSMTNIGRIRTEETKERISKSRIGKYVGDKNPFYGKTHTEDSRDKISKAGLRSKHRRLVRSIRKYIRKDGTEILLDSSWEEALAQRLDELDIKWIRPTNPIDWTDKANKKRHYFPDFYLEEYNIYLDPKNTAVMSAQKEKVEWLLLNRKDIYFLKTLEECKNYTPAFV